MLSEQEERKIREHVRSSLSNILGTPNPDTNSVSPEPTDPARLAEAERVITEETESYYRSLGWEKHESRAGRVSWVSASQAASLKSRRRRKRRPFKLKINPKIALVWTVTITLAVLIVVYLTKTQVLSNLAPS